MTLKSELMARGMPAGQANLLGQDAASPPLTSTGTTQLTALPLVSDFAIVATVAANSGVILPMRGEVFVTNTSGTALTVYPPVGGNINGGTLNAGFSVPGGKSAIFKSNGLTYGAIAG